MYYQLYEFNHAALQPARAYADAVRLFYSNPLNPMAQTYLGRTLAAGAELFERTTRRYTKPAFGLTETNVNGVRVAVHEEIVWKKPFCQLLHFKRDLPEGARRGPSILMVAPMSGHYATLLRGTVETMLPYADVYITDWTDARTVALSEGMFDLDDFIDYLIEMFQHLGPDTHVMAVCQPSVPVLAAVSLMEARKDKCTPASMTLMGGPIDTRQNPTAVNKLAEEKGIGWFRENAVMPVPWPNPGFMRMVYPGFLQLSGFMSMNLDRHITAHKEFFMHLVKNDGDSAEKHRDFYDEYLAVMDLTAEFYLQTVETVFIRHDLPKGQMKHRGKLVDPKAIRRVALLTVEGENDDISGVGQTEAAHRLCENIPADMRHHYLQPAVGHYGVFNGSRFRSEIAPRILDFMRSNPAGQAEKTSATATSAPKPRAAAPKKPAAATSGKGGPRKTASSRAKSGKATTAARRNGPKPA
ncbi:polyhydroxyalkanoate depolymerase [Nitratireductor indicus]|uniref:Intracellular PHB depolymerase n=1 Tax=Nitratireductor indicus C115 TaxID=1231190 RepID=K2P2U8_9HYPH|nr:polyhydroxyalkanoate depolymerase [Nitratireductor indicus]EKF41676.1 intracellular PHB depolymerase [Nitratireductor indicus C115]MDS1137042.1 polyhydroxyalkanoate depolymerase [Nitratireductor indicus]SFQ68386.1 poly(3-hydroxybutyrate) depolymerase [Nitratireductor indicus]